VLFRSIPSATAAPPTSTGGGNTIAIKNFAFNPSSLTVKTGTVVTWLNQDGVPHIIVSDTGSPAAFSSDSLSSGASYTFTFTQPGTYTYHCSIHPSMKGTIIVQS
jgi:plastocyanin